MPNGIYDLTCKSSDGIGWMSGADRYTAAAVGSYVTISGTRYCEYFSDGYEMKQSVQIRTGSIHIQFANRCY